jgi:hypothetical protein
VCAFVHKSWHKIARTLSQSRSRTNTRSRFPHHLAAAHFCSSVAAPASRLLSNFREIFLQRIYRFSVLTLVNLGVLQRCFCLGSPSLVLQRKSALKKSGRIVFEAVPISCSGERLRNSSFTLYFCISFLPGLIPMNKSVRKGKEEIFPNFVILKAADQRACFSFVSFSCISFAMKCFCLQSLPSPGRLNIYAADSFGDEEFR